MLDKVQSAAEVRASVEQDKHWVTVAFTWDGLRALGVDEGSLATFPEEFKQGMVARAEILGDSGENHPNNWVGGLASPDLHAIAILFARDAAERGRCQIEHDKLVEQCEGVEVLSTLDLEATPPFNYAHDHFGYRDRLSEPVIEGLSDAPTPGSGAPLKPGEFILGYPDEDGPPANLPQPEVLSRNGSYCFWSCSLPSRSSRIPMALLLLRNIKGVVTSPTHRNSFGHTQDKESSSWIDLSSLPLANGIVGIIARAAAVGLIPQDTVYQIQALINPCHASSDPILGEARRAFMDQSSVTSKRSGSPSKVRCAAVI